MPGALTQQQIMVLPNLHPSALLAFRGNKTPWICFPKIGWKYNDLQTWKYNPAWKPFWLTKPQFLWYSISLNISKYEQSFVGIIWLCWFMRKEDILSFRGFYLEGVWLWRISGVTQRSECLFLKLNGAKVALFEFVWVWKIHN